MTLIRVRRIGRTRLVMALAPCTHDLSGPQQLRADRQAVGPGGREIDAQPDVTVLLEERDDDARGRGALGYREDAAALEGIEDLAEVLKFACGNEQDLAGAQP